MTDVALAEPAYLGIDFLLTEPEPLEEGVMVSFSSNTIWCSSCPYSTTCCSSTPRRQSESKHDWAVTSSNWFLLVIVHDKRRWFILAVTSSNWFFLVVQTGCDQLKLVLTGCWNWLKLVLTRGDGSNWLWLARTSSSLLLTSSNWFFLVVETDCD